MTDAKLFYESCTRWKHFEEYCGTVNASLVAISQRIASNVALSDDDKVKKLKNLKACTKQISKIDAEAKGRSEVTLQISRTIGSIQPGDNFEDLKTTYKSGCDEAVSMGKSRRIDKADGVKQIDHLLSIAQKEDTEVDEIQENLAHTQQTQRCPFLGGEMVTPMRNTECGHVYSLIGAISFLFQKNAPRSREVPKVLDRVPSQFTAMCPRAGCGKMYRAGTLKRDYATELTQRQAQQSASHGRESLDVEELI